MYKNVPFRRGPGRQARRRHRRRLLLGPDLRPQSIKAEKSASTTTTNGVSSPTVEGRMFARDVEGPPPEWTAQCAMEPGPPPSYPTMQEPPVVQSSTVVTAPNPLGRAWVLSPLHEEAWKYYLAFHPDEQFAETLLDYIQNGVPIDYQGPNAYREHPNWPSTSKFAAEVQASIDSDLQKGRKAGPWPFPPFKDFVGSPLGAFQKRRSTKVRTIHDLSWPPAASVNAHIPSESCSMRYITVQTAANNVRRLGRGCYQSKLDLADSFKFVNVNPKYWHLLGSTWWRKGSDGKMIKEYFVDTVLPFGLRQSPKLFDMFAKGLEWVMRCKGATCVEHYMDDFHTVAKTKKECALNLKIMLEACHELGLEVNPNKVVPPTTRLEFLGIIIDSVTMELQISDSRLHDIKSELCLWMSRRSAQKRSLLRIIGKLTFVSQVVRSGKTFIRRLIDLSKKAKYLFHKVRINTQAREDFKWWLTYLADWNGISILPKDCWHTSDALQLYTDASDIGIGCVFDKDWFYEKLNDACKCFSINWRELYAITKAIATFGAKLAGKSVIFKCDNSSVVDILNSGTSPSPHMMSLVRSLFYYCAHYNIQCKAEWLQGSKNVDADNLSRLKIEEFKLQNPTVKLMTHPSVIVYDEGLM